MALGLAVACGCGGEDAGRSSLKAAGLPLDLAARQSRLTTLQLPPAASSWNWLSAPLDTLIADGTQIASLGGLPPSVRRLDLRFTTRLVVLSDLPQGLESLDLRGSQVESLAGLPAALRCLRLGGRQLAELPPLPAALEELELENTGIHRVEGLPASLRTLTLSGSSFESVDGLPRDLRSLTLIGTNVRGWAALPDSLQSLVLRENRQLKDPKLPPFLSHLRIEGGGACPPLSALQELSSLALRCGLDSKNLLPGSIAVLSVDLDLQSHAPALSRVEWPPYLRSLELKNGSDGGPAQLPPLPRSLERLELRGYSGGPVAGIPLGLRRLALPQLDAAGLAQVLRTVDDLDLSGLAAKSLARVPLGEGLRSLSARDSQLVEVGRLPEGLEVLDLSGSRFLTSLPPLPPRLKTLRVGYTKLARLPPLPGTLEELDLSHTDIHVLAGLPKGLKTLIVAAGQLASLRGMPPDVQTLRFAEPLPRE